MKYRGYEHGIYKHSDLRTNLSIKNIPYEVEDNNETEARRSQDYNTKIVWITEKWTGEFNTP